ncbi:MAG TPA: hypothetical protein DIT05_15525 [Morganella sp. (in: Bacteria)]|nr:hypothetical protein [Morganella sp. (in: enterobacteria)]
MKFIFLLKKYKKTDLFVIIPTIFIRQHLSNHTRASTLTSSTIGYHVFPGKLSDNHEKFRQDSVNIL